MSPERRECVPKALQKALYILFICDSLKGPRTTTLYNYFHSYALKSLNCCTVTLYVHSACAVLCLRGERDSLLQMKASKHT